MGITNTLLTAFLFILWIRRSYASNDIEVTCLDSQATTITEGGIVANCAFNGLTRTSTINPWLLSLANVLQGVNASNNHIKSVAVFPELPRVLTLTLSHNSIRRINSSAFAGMDNLQNLDLSYNIISGDILKDVLVGKKTSTGYQTLSIRTLNLSHNNITTLHPDLFQHVEFLRVLHLDNNPLIVNEAFSLSLKKLPELSLLDLAGASLKILPNDTFTGISKLSALLLNSNEFTQVPDLSSLGNSLELLNINQNPITELNNSSFNGLDRLREVVISGMPELVSIKTGTFSNLRSMKIISCSYNPKLSDIEEQAFWDFKKRTSPLKQVYLNNNALKQLKKYVLPWTKMAKVTLDGNRWVCDCQIHWLAKYLQTPNMTVDRSTELRCSEPTWLNGTQILFWKINTESRDENYPCLAEKEEERKEIERLKMLAATTTTELPIPTAQSVPEETEQEGIKFYHFIIIAVIVSLVIIVVSMIGVNKYRQYRPVYDVKKMSSPLQSEMKYITSNEAERKKLVS